MNEIAPAKLEEMDVTIKVANISFAKDVHNPTTNVVNKIAGISLFLINLTALLTSFLYPFVCDKIP